MRKLITACMALAAFLAFAMPSTALGTNDPDLTDEGALLATGSLIKGTNIGETFMKDESGESILTRCTTSTMTGSLAKNNGTEVEGTITTANFTGSGTEGECTSTFGGIDVTTNAGEGLPWCLRSNPNMTTDEFQVRGGACNEAARSITFVLDSTSIGECKYKRETAIPGTYQTSPEDAVLSISGVRFDKEAGSFLCPSKGFLHMTFTLETDTATAKPLYIS